MKRLAWLFLAVLCSAILLNAEDKGRTVSGWICDSKCVVQSAGRNTCDANCTERSGDPVFISDQGKVMAVANPDVCASHMGKHVKARGTMEGFPQDPSKADTIRLEELMNDSGAG